MAALSLAQSPSTLRSSRGLRSGAGGLVVVSGLAVGEAVTHEGAVETGELQLDVTISHWHDAALTAAARTLDVVASPVVGSLLVALICAVLWWRRATAPAVALATMTAFGWLAASAAKLLLHRERPPMETVHALVRETAADSCPSGHTAFAASFVAGSVLALALAGRSTRGAWLLGVAFVVAVTASRLYLGAHFLGDVVTSVLLVTGLALAATPFVTTLARRVEARRHG